MKKIAFKGILAGGIIDIVSTNIMSIPFILYVMSKIDRSNIPEEQSTKALIAAINANPTFYTINILIGSICSVLGGYVAAKIAKHDEILNGSLSSFLCVGGSIYTISTGMGSDPNFLKGLAELPVSPMLGMFGGYLYVKREKIG